MYFHQSGKYHNILIVLEEVLTSMCRTSSIGNMQNAHLWSQQNYYESMKTFPNNISVCDMNSVPLGVVPLSNVMVALNGAAITLVMG